MIEGQFRLLFTRAGVVITMSHVLLPLMVLPIYAVLITIPADLLPAASLGRARSGRSQGSPCR